jgi:hypothetical protein
MLDQIELQIAYRLAQKHNYPFAQNIYIDIFRSFSHFPLPLSHFNINGPGKTIAYMALVVYYCFETKESSLSALFNKILDQLSPKVQSVYPQDCTVETFLGASLYHCHPSSIKNDLCHRDVMEMFTKEQLYEFQLKMKTISINIL